ncbi:hypothetical protein PENTCL1PPCAC_4999, partial [Pristionchus entomophagus]
PGPSTSITIFLPPTSEACVPYCEGYCVRGCTATGNLPSSQCSPSCTSACFSACNATGTAPSPGPLTLTVRFTDTTIFTTPSLSLPALRDE